MSDFDAGRHVLAAHAALETDAHIDDAVDRLVQRIGWAEAFLALAALPEERAATGMYSMICGLFISDNP